MNPCHFGVLLGELVTSALRSRGSGQVNEQPACSSDLLTFGVQPPGLPKWGPPCTFSLWGLFWGPEATALGSGGTGQVDKRPARSSDLLTSWMWASLSGALHVPLSFWGSYQGLIMIHGATALGVWGVLIRFMSNLHAVSALWPLGPRPHGSLHRTVLLLFLCE